MSESVSRHPPVETMAAFIEGALTPAETAAVSEHLRGCGECRTVIGETARFEEEQNAEGAARRRPASRRDAGVPTRPAHAVDGRNAGVLAGWPGGVSPPRAWWLLIAA